MSVLDKISYGLFVVTAKNSEKDNGCICNTVIQVTLKPERICFAINKDNYTTEMIKQSGVFNVSIISQDATFDLFKRFGFVSGRDTDKFSGFDGAARAKNGVMYVTEGTNAYISAKVVEVSDLGTHLLFVADVEHSEDISDTPSATYAYYHSNIKPKPQAASSTQTVWRCKICGYEYKGEQLPDDFICPLCKHGKDDFEKIS